MAEKPRNIRLDLEYDGTGFAGWAKQPGLPTIEGTLEKTLGRILQEEMRLSVAGRTDSGVHARGQVASLRTGNPIEAPRLQRAANKLLPRTLVITAAADAPPDFDARRSALSRTYSYAVLNRRYPSAFRYRFVYHYAGRLDVALMREAAEMALGHHDFTAFTPVVTEHSYFRREVVESLWEAREDGNLLVYRITAGSFLRNMVRVLVGTMLEIGRGYRPVGDMRRLLVEGADRTRAGATAAPQGLCLEKVEY